MDVAVQLQFDGDLPEEPKFNIRNNFSVTLLSQKIIGRQVARGLIVGYNLGKTRANLSRSQECQERQQALMVGRGEIRVFKSRVVYAAIHSPEIEHEIDAIHDTLALGGLKGLAKREKPYVPHVTIGEAGKGYCMSTTEQRHVQHMLDEQLPHELMVEPWQSYPFDIFDC